MSESPPKSHNGPSDADMRAALEAERLVPSSQDPWFKHGDEIVAAQASRESTPATSSIAEEVSAQSDEKTPRPKNAWLAYGNEIASNQPPQEENTPTEHITTPGQKKARRASLKNAWLAYGNERETPISPERSVEPTLGDMNLSKEEDSVANQEKSEEVTVNNYDPLDNPWAKYGSTRRLAEERFAAKYPSGTAIPPEKLEQYLALKDKQLDSFKAGVSQEEREKASKELEVFVENAIREESEEDGDIMETPKDWRAKLTDLIKGVGAKTKENVNWWTNSEKHLIRRAEDLGEEAKKLGITEKMFRRMGENYNKRNWKTKLLVGASLGIGAGLSLSAGLPVIFATFGAGLVAQRTAGLASMYLKFEKDAIAKDIKWGKEKAMGKAILYTAGMSYAIKEGVEAIGETSWGANVREWLAQKLEHTNSPASVSSPAIEEAPVSDEALVDPTRPLEPMATTESPPISTETSPGVRALEQTPAVAETRAIPSPEEVFSLTSEPSAPEVPVEEAPTIQDISVQAAPGRGYEDMLWRLAKKLPDDFVITKKMEGSDIARLLAAREDGTLAKVVHDLATDHKAFLENGTSKMIVLKDTISFDDSGNIQLNGEETASALEDRDVTPPYHPEAAPVPESAETPAPVAEVPPVESSELPTESVEVGGSAPESVEDGAAPPENMPPVEVRESIGVNKYGVEVPYLESHLYADKDGRVMVFGNNFDARLEAAQKFARENPRISIWIQAEKPVLYQGKLVPWIMEVKYGGFFSGMQITNPGGPPDPSFIGAIDVSTFTKKLK